MTYPDVDLATARADNNRTGRQISRDEHLARAGELLAEAETHYRTGDVSGLPDRDAILARTAAALATAHYAAAEAAGPVLRFDVGTDHV